MSDKTRCFRCGATISDDNARKLASMCCACGDAPDPRDAEIERLKAEVERLKATLDGDPGQTATPEQRRGWRLSAVRYADKVEAERDQARAELTRLRGGLAEEKEHSKRLDVALLACEEQIGHSLEIKQRADRAEWERDNIASINARIYLQLDAARADLAAAQKERDGWMQKALDAQREVVSGNHEYVNATEALIKVADKLAAAQRVVEAAMSALTAYGVHDPAEKIKRAVVILRGEGLK